MGDCIHKREYYTCKRLRLLEYLVKLGFKPAETIPDAENPKYNWWLFKNTVELETAVADYFKKKM